MFSIEIMQRNLCSGGVMLPENLSKADVHRWMKEQRSKRRLLRVLTRTQNLIEIYEGVSPPPRKELPPCTPIQ